MTSLDGGKRLIFQPAKEILRVDYPGSPPSTLIAPLSSTNASGVDDWIRKTDFSCFVLRSQDITLQRVRLVNVIKQDVDKVKKLVDRIRGLGLIDPNNTDIFDLDHPVNKIVLDPSMHIKHLYGIWAITGSLSTLQEVLLQVKTVNQTSQLCCNKYGFKADAFIPRYSPAVRSIFNPIFEIVVLQPCPMVRDQLWFAGRPPSQERNLPGISPGTVFSDEGCLKIRTENGSIIDYPPFCHHSGREAKDKINIFLNAHAKFEHHTRHFGLDGLSSHSRELIVLTNEIVEAIYFVPVPAPGSIADKKAKEDPELAAAQQVTRKKRKASPTSGSRKSVRLSQKAGSSGVAVGENQADPQQAPQTARSSRSSSVSDNSVQSSEYYSSLEPLRDTPSDDEYGLTHEEMDILEARMADPTLTSKERAEAGMMLMFGNKIAYAPLPEVPGLPAPSTIIGLDTIRSELG